MLRHVGVVGMVLVLAGACSGDDTTEEAAPPPDTSADDRSDDADIRLVDGDGLTVCSEASYPPFEYEDEDAPLGYSGFDIELIAAVAERAGYAPISVEQTNFEDISSGAVFVDGICDVAASAIAVTSARAERLDFTDVYFTARESLLVHAESDIGSLDDLGEGDRVGVQRGTAAADRALDQVDAGALVMFDDVEELFAAFDAGELDALVHDEALNSSLAGGEDDAEVAERYTQPERYAFAVAPDRGDGLLEQLNDALAEVQADGTYDELAEEFLTPNGDG